MLLFRSEETLDHWCEARGFPRRPTLDVDQLWHLARAWYAGRLEKEARRPDAAEIPSIFAAIGLEGPFWSLSPSP